MVAGQWSQCCSGEPYKQLVVGTSDDETSCRSMSFCEFSRLRAERKKKTSLLTNIEALQEMSVWCDGTHEHAEWGQDAHGNFNAAKEAQYPKKMREVYIDIILHLCEALGWSAASNTHIVSRPLSQPRGRKTRPVVPEFKC